MSTLDITNLTDEQLATTTAEARRRKMANASRFTEKLVESITRLLESNEGLWSRLPFRTQGLFGEIFG